ncbi:unnamed protein product [Rotaria magnacalcarata]|uniref:Uncharacterized protein n=1 Tax=Rotaria magnacalcarata TaxID=392030 RepID=A0A817A410_9BILA|nr:unnamed protein product [Rotaria magnacalcarata]CAF4253919.1 unnamed protein product [Rotaria magnacalcarata]
MQQYRCLLFIIVFITGSSEIFGQQYEWSGSYQWSDDKCNQTQCCCPLGTLSVISNDTFIRFISNLRGRDCEKEIFSLWSPYPRDLVAITKLQSIVPTTSLIPANVATISDKIKSSSKTIPVIVVCSIIVALIMGVVSVRFTRRRRRRSLSCPSFLLP